MNLPLSEIEKDKLTNAHRFLGFLKLKDQKKFSVKLNNAIEGYFRQVQNVHFNMAVFYAKTKTLERGLLSFEVGIALWQCRIFIYSKKR